MKSVVLNGKVYVYEVGGCGEAVYVFKEAEAANEAWENALVIVPYEANDEWQITAAAALAKIEAINRKASESRKMQEYLLHRSEWMDRRATQVVFANVQRKSMTDWVNQFIRDRDSGRQHIRVYRVAVETVCAGDAVTTQGAEKKPPETAAAHAFAFVLGEVVAISASGEHGSVIGRAEYSHAEDSYYVRYKAADGRAVEAWWPESALQ